MIAASLAIVHCATWFIDLFPGVLKCNDKSHFTIVRRVTRFVYRPPCVTWLVDRFPGVLKCNGKSRFTIVRRVT